jgi:adenosylcobinamide-GDP ribazoletransferase
VPDDGTTRSATAAGGVRLALTVLTVLPVRAGRIDRSTAAVAMSVAPAIGALLGLALAGVLAGLRAAGVPDLVAAGITVAAAALLTRGLHLDGLADTVDALGSYRRGEAALEIMKKSDIGPFGVAAIGPAAVVAAWTAGRLGVVVACRRGIPAARPDGLGALVAGTVRTPVAAGIAAVVAVAASWAVPGRPWSGPAAVAAALLAAFLLVRHATRRFGGVTGDVIGAAVETATTVALVVLTVG